MVVVGFVHLLCEVIDFLYSNGVYVVTGAFILTVGCKKLRIVQKRKKY